MDLQPPKDGLSAYSLDNLVLLVQAHVKQQGYAVVKQRTRNNK